MTSPRLTCLSRSSSLSTTKNLTHATTMIDEAMARVVDLPGPLEMIGQAGTTVETSGIA
jgi:hypothetical protein